MTQAREGGISALSLRDRQRWAKHRLAVERRKATHREYYLRQKRELAARPEYLAHRRAMYAERVRPKAERESLSTMEIDDTTNTDEIGNSISN